MLKKTTRKKFPAIFRWIFWVLIAQLILFNISAALYAYRFTHVYDASEKPHQPGNNIFTKTWHLFSGPRQFRSVIRNFPPFTYDTLHLKTGDGIDTETWLAKTDSVSKGTVILLHGFQSNKGMLLPEAEAFLSMHYNVLLIDLRAHGNSSGHTTTLGIKEQEEALVGYDYLSVHGEKKIFLFGSSMGAVVAAKVIADHDLKPAGLILEMPYASLRAFCKARLRGMGFKNAGAIPFSWLITLWSGLETGHNGFNHNTISYCRKIQCPVLMQWGALDSFAPADDTNRIFNSIASPNKKLVIYDHAGHESLIQNDAVKWQAEVNKFFSGLSQ